ncbi:hypothetical protein [Pyrinomonas methylaliphatogenes]|uniref:Uncharacterized protein n=1 Tax=Pyrinomonas methylaliphatogenes TaxID=454194 RepID=A0A0B6WV33_9BACT|nr:hypothetical protein [Pyrinomonas methylaliphatogenes]CDM64607.1 hypothetical protein PYK22_00601 [Pyrinomonas methylaliphatogenes]
MARKGMRRRWLRIYVALVVAAINVAPAQAQRRGRMARVERASSTNLRSSNDYPPTGPYSSVIAVGGHRAPGAVPVHDSGAAVRAITGSLRGNRIAVRDSQDRPFFDLRLTGARIVRGRLELEGEAVPVVGQRTFVRMTVDLSGTLAKYRPPEEEQAVARAPVTPTTPAAGQNPAQPPGQAPANPESASGLGQLAQATQSTARTAQTPTAPGGRTTLTEAITAPPVQTAAVAGARLGATTGCEILFLRFRLPEGWPARTARGGGRRRAAEPTYQLGVMVPSRDNKRGEEINQTMCRVIRAMQAGEGERLNEELARLNQLLARASSAEPR